MRGVYCFCELRFYFFGFGIGTNCLFRNYFLIWAVRLCAGCGFQSLLAGIGLHYSGAPLSRESGILRRSSRARLGLMRCQKKPKRSIDWQIAIYKFKLKLKSIGKLIRQQKTTPARQRNYLSLHATLARRSSLTKKHKINKKVQRKLPQRCHALLHKHFVKKKSEKLYYLLFCCFFSFHNLQQLGM